MVSKNNNVLETKGKKPIVYDICYDATSRPRPVIIFCHGYKGFKDWGAWHLVAEAFARSGFFFLKFNFSHNGGTISQPIDFPDLEAFANNNFSTELDDLNRIIDFVSTNKDYEGLIDLQKINLLAHSRGAGIVLIKAQEDPRINSVISWAGVSDFKARFQEGTEAFDKWQRTGVTFVENGRTKQQMPHYIQFYEDFKAHEKRLTIKRAVQNLDKPQLIIHGSEDTTVSIKEAEAIHQWNPKSELRIIKHADHVFGAKHPWEEKELTGDLKKAVDLTIDFLN